MKRIAETVTAQGMVLQFHNHFWEMAPVDGRLGLDILYEKLPPQLLQTQLDTCWVEMGGQDPSAYVTKYAGRIPTVHLKDYWRVDSRKGIVVTDRLIYRAEAASGEFAFRPLGKGFLNVKASVEAAVKGGAQWLIVEQDQPSMGKTPMECVAMSMEYLKSIYGNTACKDCEEAAK